MSTALAALERFYSAVNRNDLAAVGADFDPRIERIEPEGFPSSGTYHGSGAVLAQVARGRATWAEGSCDPERFLANGERIVAYVHVRVRLHGAADWIDARFADGFEFRAGRITRFRTFADRAEALRWAGIDEPAAS